MNSLRRESQNRDPEPLPILHEIRQQIGITAAQMRRQGFLDQLCHRALREILENLARIACISHEQVSCRES
jgi:hypothetical protein